jgi:type IV pilus secretin PilQ/predicted competence protein
MLIVIVAAFMMGCAHHPKTEKKDTFFNEWRARAESSKGFSPSIKRRSISIAPPESAPATAAGQAAQTVKALPEKKITLRMHQTDVAVLLRALARAVDQNIMISENVKGRISINVNQTPWDQVFLGILNTLGLSYSYDGDILRVVTVEDRDKHIRQMDIDSKIRSKQRELELKNPLATQVIEIEYTDAGQLKQNLEKFLTQQDEGKQLGSIMVDDHTNALIVQALRSDLEHIVPLIEALDRPTPQILIEANIVETTKEVARDLGVQWGGLAQNSGTWIYPGANSTGVVGNPLSSGGIDPTSGFAVNFPAALENNLGLTLGVAVETVGESLLAVQLSALQKEGKLNILSSPSITTLDNQSATIESGDEVPFQTVEDGEVKIEYKKAVLSLKVTPHVIEGDTLKLNIETSKDELDFSRTVAGNPTIVTKKADTKVILFDGQTTVIGGLNKETDSNTESGVPGLKDIPLLGWLFKGTDKSNKLEEVLIFITPHILAERTASANPPTPPPPTGTP